MRLLLPSALCLGAFATLLAAQHDLSRVSGVVAVPPPRAGTGVPGPANVGPNFRFNRDTGTKHQNETFVAVNPRDANNAIASANDYRPGDARASFYVTLDGGKTVANDGVFPLDTSAGFQASGDPSCAFDGRGNGYICFLEFFRRGGRGGALYVAKTTNGGRSFVKRQAYRKLNNLPDKPLITADQRLAGSFAGSLYISFTGFFTSPFGINLIFSRDRSATWSSPRRLGSGQGSHVGIGPGGEVYVVWQAGSSIVVNRSFNGGQTFTGLRTVARIARNPSPLPPTRFRCNSFPSICVDTSSGPFKGRIHVLWSSRSGGSSEIFSTFSTNQGLTWSAPRRVNDVAKGDQFFQWSCTDENGVVFASWFDRRNDASNVRYDSYASASYDGGLTWVKNWRVSTVASNPNIGFSGRFIGDYSGLAAGGGKFYPVWCDTRRGNQDCFSAAVQADFELGPTSITAALGGTVQLPVKAGPNHRGEVYLLVAGLSGTMPGVGLGGGVTLRLNPDTMTTLSLLAANTGPFQGTVGVLGSTGMPAAQPRFTAAPGLLNSIRGRTLSFAYLTLRPAAFRYGSNPVGVKVN